LLIFIGHDDGSRWLRLLFNNCQRQWIRAIDEALDVT
jgi:hypothetical protein